MKKNFFSGLIALLAVAFMAFTTPSLTGSYTVDTSASQVAWKGYKVTGQHSGTIGIKEGSLDFDNGALAGGSFTLDMTSLTVTDLEGEMKGSLEGHLMSPDFFGVEKHPTAKFVITKVAKKGTPNDYKITGNLTIKETTKEIKFYANVTEADGGATATADITVDRSEFDVRYGSGSFIDNLGDKTIYDEFDLSISLKAK